MPDSKNGDTCTICLDELNENISILKCRHSFHEGCISEWIKARLTNEENATCPMCRHEIDRKLYPWTLDDLFEHNERKCCKCKGDLCNGHQFCLHPDSLEIFCSACVSDKKTYSATREILEVSNNNELEAFYSSHK